MVKNISDIWYFHAHSHLADGEGVSGYILRIVSFYYPTI